MSANVTKHVMKWCICVVVPQIWIEEIYGVLHSGVGHIGTGEVVPPTAFNPMEARGRSEIKTNVTC